METTLLGGGNAQGGLNELDPPVEDNVVDIQTGPGGGLAPAAAPTAVPIAITNASDAGDPQDSLVDPRAEEASATNLFNERLMDGIGAVMERARGDESSNFLDLGKSLRASLDGHLETALGAVRDNYAVPASFIEGLKRQGGAAVRNVGADTGNILAVRRRDQHVASVNALTDGLTRTVQQNPNKLPVALARLKAGLEVARGAVLSPDEAGRKLAEGKRALNLAALTRLAESKPDTVIAAAPKGGLSALGKDDADAVLGIAKRARAREAARAEEQRALETATKRAASLVAGKPAKAFDPTSSDDVKLVDAVYGQIDTALAAELANPATRREAAGKVARFAERTGVVPPKVAGRIDAGLGSSDATKLIPAALSFATIAGQAPKLLTCVAGDAQCLRAMRIATAVKAGSSDEEAIRIADTEVAGATPQTLDTRRTAYRQDRTTIEAGNTAFLDARRGETKSETINQPAPNPGEPARFNALVERYYGPTGDLETARATALLAMRRGVTLEGGGGGKFQTIAAGGGDGKALDPNATLTETGEKTGGKVTKAKKEGFAKEARALVEGKASRFFTGPARKELEAILGELKAAEGDTKKTTEAMDKLRALVGKHRRDIDALGEGLEEGITEEGKRIIAGLEKAEATGGDVFARTLEILAGTTVESEREELARQDRVRKQFPLGPGPGGAGGDVFQRDVKLPKIVAEIAAELPGIRNIVGAVVAKKLTVEAAQALIDGKLGKGVGKLLLAGVAIGGGGRIARRFAKKGARLRRAKRAGEVERGSGVLPRPKHTANVTVRGRKGDVRVRTRFVSGNMTAEEKKLGHPQRMLATHTEVRAINAAKLKPGETMEITGLQEACKSCKGHMNRAARKRRVRFVYKWRENGRTRVWIADGR